MKNKRHSAVKNIDDKIMKKKEKRTQNDVSNRKIFAVNKAMINVGTKKVRIVFFNNPSLKKPDVSKVRQCPIEIRMTKSVWLDVIDELTLKTVVSLIQNKRKDPKDCPKERPPEVMFS